MVIIDITTAYIAGIITSTMILTALFITALKSGYLKILHVETEGKTWQDTIINLLQKSKQKKEDDKWNKKDTEWKREQGKKQNKGSTYNWLLDTAEKDKYKSK